MEIHVNNTRSTIRKLSLSGKPTYDRQPENSPSRNRQLARFRHPTERCLAWLGTQRNHNNLNIPLSFREKRRIPMQVEYINPFLNAIVKTFGTMLNCEVERGTPHLKDGAQLGGPVSGVIGLSGKAAGTVVLNLSEEAALKAASTMLMMELAEMDDDVLDAVGELTNMVAGCAKTELAQFSLSLSLPNVVTGKDHEVRFPSNVTPVCVPYNTDFGPISLEVGFVVSNETAGV